MKLMTPDTLDKLQKATAIVRNVMNTASYIGNSLSKMPKYGARGYRRRTKRYKQNVNSSLLGAALNAYFGAVRNASIVSAPIPKYPRGGNCENENAVYFSKEDLIKGEKIVPSL